MQVISGVSFRKGDYMIKFIKITVFIVLFSFPLFSEAQPTEQKIETITRELQKYKSSWTIQETTKLLRDAQNVAMDIHVLTDDTGKIRKLTVLGGETVMIDGKDISGNLGSKTTHGNNSPIIEDVKDSQIAIGDHAKANNEEITDSQVAKGDKNILSKKFEINFKLFVTLSIAFTLSLAFNIYTFRKIKKN